MKLEGILLSCAILQFSLCINQDIHRVWPSLRDPYRNSSNSEIKHELSPLNKIKQETKSKAGHSPTTLIYGSPICVGRCIIFQIFWSNSTSSVLGLKLPRIPTFPRPRVNSTRKALIRRI